MPVATLERKQLTLTDVSLDTLTGSFAGYASCFGGVDAYSDTIVPGAYAATLPKYLTDGFIGWGHDDRIPVAYPTVAREDDHGLWIEATFHGTADAQAARQITSERLAAGKRMGLSIGYYPVKAESGPDGTRRLLQIDLVETSLVLVPADDAARVASVKGTEPELKPFPNEHACRLRDPGDFQPNSFRRTSRAHDGKTYDIIMGKLKGATAMTEQAYRYPKDTWSASAAQAHCDSHDGASFEPASGGKATLPPGSYEARAAAIEDAYAAAYCTEADGAVTVVATFGETAVVAVPTPDADSDAEDAFSYARVSYSVSEDGAVRLGAPVPEAADTLYPVAAGLRRRARQAEDASLTAVEHSWDVHLAQVQAATADATVALQAFHIRALAQSRLESKDGRILSAATRARLQQVLDAEDSLGAAFSVIRQLLTETEPAPKGWSAVIALRALESRLRLHGLVPAEGGCSDADPE